MGGQPENVIACRQLVKRYGDVEAVRGLDLEVRRGECFGLLGPNGAGKTTTIEILEGLVEPTSGDVTLFGKTWRNDEQSLRERIGITLQDTRLTDKLTVEETLTLFSSFYPRGPSATELLAKVQLEEKRKARYENLSGGQKQRVAVACALAGDPELLFLDEPTTGLDPQSRRSLWDLVLDFKGRGGSILLTTHYMDEAEKLCDRIGVVDHGKCIALGTPRELIRSLGGEEIIDFAVDGEMSLEMVRELQGVVAARCEADGFVVTTERLHVTLPLLLAAVEASRTCLARLSTHRATLEDVFVHLTGKKLRE
ncbi:MAG: ABC transporter ATP-binding protein [Polyangiaceae bacterium]|nr:ABC transporter ATP-binding protein [Polyangiaceae bacterium]